MRGNGELWNKAAVEWRLWGVDQSAQVEHLELPFPTWIVLRIALQQRGSSAALDHILENGRIISSWAARPSEWAGRAIPSVRPQQTLCDPNSKWCFWKQSQKGTSFTQNIGCPVCWRAEATGESKPLTQHDVTLQYSHLCHYFVFICKSCIKCLSKLVWVKRGGFSNADHVSVGVT